MSREAAAALSINLEKLRTCFGKTDEEWLMSLIKREEDKYIDWYYLKVPSSNRTLKNWQEAKTCDRETIEKHLQAADHMRKSRYDAKRKASADDGDTLPEHVTSKGQAKKKKKTSAACQSATSGFI